MPSSFSLLFVWSSCTIYYLPLCTSLVLLLPLRLYRPLQVYRSSTSLLGYAAPVDKDSVKDMSHWAANHDDPSPTRTKVDKDGDVDRLVLRTSQRQPGLPRRKLALFSKTQAKISRYSNQSKTITQLRLTIPWLCLRLFRVSLVILYSKSLRIDLCLIRWILRKFWKGDSWQEKVRD